MPVRTSFHRCSQGGAPVASWCAMVQRCDGVKAHVLALICPSHRMLRGLWVAMGALVASAPGLQAEEGQQRYTSRTRPHVTCVTRHAQNAKPTSRCRTVAPWSTTVAPWSTTMRRVFHPETNDVKASPHRHKWMLSRGAPADPSDPWNSHAAPVSRRQNGPTGDRGDVLHHDARESTKLSDPAHIAPGARRTGSRSRTRTRQ